MKTNHYWGIAKGKLLLPATIRFGKKEAVEDFIKQFVYEEPWTALEERGYRVVKVDCTWEEKGK